MVFPPKSPSGNVNNVGYELLRRCTCDKFDVKLSPDYKKLVFEKIYDQADGSHIEGFDSFQKATFVQVMKRFFEVMDRAMLKENCDFDKCTLRVGYKIHVWARALVRMAMVRVSKETGCHLPKGQSVLKSRDMPIYIYKVSIHKTLTVPLNVIAAVLNTEKAGLPREISARPHMFVKLCSNKTCTKIEHVKFGMPKEATSRSACPGKKKCTHVPPCIK